MTIATAEPIKQSWHVNETPHGRVIVDTAQLIKALTACKVAISSQETRYYLNGICLESDDDGLHVVATDGHRLVAAKLKKWTRSEGSFRSAIVPRLDVPKLIKWLRGRVHIHQTSGGYGGGPWWFDAGDGITRVLMPVRV